MLRVAEYEENWCTYNSCIRDSWKMDGQTCQVVQLSHVLFVAVLLIFRDSKSGVNSHTMNKKNLVQKFCAGNNLALTIPSRIHRSKNGSIYFRRRIIFRDSIFQMIIETFHFWINVQSIESIFRKRVLFQCFFFFFFYQRINYWKLMMRIWSILKRRKTAGYWKTRIA